MKRAKITGTELNQTPPANHPVDQLAGPALIAAFPSHFTADRRDPRNAKLRGLLNEQRILAREALFASKATTQEALQRISNELNAERLRLGR
jgi:hypothetical protein